MLQRQSRKIITRKGGLEAVAYAGFLKRGGEFSEKNFNCDIYWQGCISLAGVWGHQPPEANGSLGRWENFGFLLQKLRFLVMIFDQIHQQIVSKISKYFNFDCFKSILVNLKLDWPQPRP